MPCHLYLAHIFIVPARTAAATAGTEALRDDAVAKVARPLLNYANVRGARAKLRLTLHLYHGGQSLSDNDFATILDRILARIRQMKTKVIEAAPLEKVDARLPPPIPDRRFRRM